VVGAIFLAHFLRLNSSLTSLNFSRNDVQKDGAKALAQSLLGNPQCALRIVNNMGPSLAPSQGRGGKPGIDFASFRTNQLRVINLSKRLMDDDDFVFLEEWLRRYDCVRELDISNNLIYRDGVRKLCRHIKDTKTLQKLICNGLPVDLEGTALLCRATVESETLEYVSLPLGPCDEKPERQQVMQQYGVGLARHPVIQQIGQQVKLAEVREGRLREFRGDRMVSTWPRAEAAVYMWFLAAVRPAAPLERLVFGSGGRPTKEYPEVNGSPRELWSGLIGIVHDIRSLQFIQIGVPRGYGPLMMEMMRALTRCSSLKTLHLYGYASSVMRDSQLPQEWAQVGPLPRWLIDRIPRSKVHWQALWGLLGNLVHLESFNDVQVGGGLREQVDVVMLLLIQCLEGCAAEFAQSGDHEPQLVANLSKEADVNAFCDVLRLLNRMPICVSLMFNNKNVEKVKAQMALLAAPLSGSSAGEGGPRFTHAVRLKNSFVSEELLKNVDCHAQLREFGYERIDGVLPVLFAALCGREKPLPVEQIRVSPKWELSTRLVKKRFSEKQRRQLDSIQAALVRSERFREVHTKEAGVVHRDQIEAMSPQEFSELMAGLSIDDLPEQEVAPPRTTWRAFPSPRAYDLQDPDVETEFVPLPLDEETKSQLQKLSLCMCNLRPYISKVTRPDEWAGPSQVLWMGERRFRRPGEWNEFESEHASPLALDDEEEAENEGRHVRFHWRENLRIGSKQACAMYTQSMDPHAVPFQDELVHESLRSLLVDSDALTWLDLRGNGLSKEDANVLLALLEEHRTLVSLNLIPVTLDDAQTCKILDLDGSGIQRHVKRGRDPDEFDEDEEDPVGERYARQALDTNIVRLDEGDGFLFMSLVTPTNFPDLQTVVLRRHEIPDVALPHITDALVSLPSVSCLQLSDLRLSSRGASLLLQAAVEMAPRLLSLNGLPLNRLMQHRDHPEAGPIELKPPIEWNDFTLGAMMKLSLWSLAGFSVHGGGGGEMDDVDADEFRLHGRSLTDVGLRGLCGMLRHFAGQERVPNHTSLARGPLHLTTIDLNGNSQITDHPVADLCHTLQQPVAGSGLRHSLRDLNLRSCSRLRSRSAHELLQLIQRLREAAVSSGSGSSSLGTGLLMLNGVDLGTLQAFTRSSGSRASVPPMLLRTYVTNTEDPHRRNQDFAMLSECDVHFYASVLHLFPQIPYCHVHIVIPPDDDSRPGSSDMWGEAHDSKDETCYGGGHHGGLMTVTRINNNSPFPMPRSSSMQAASSVQKHLDAAKRLFETCPIATQLRLSMVPCVPGCEDLLAEGDSTVLAGASSSGQSGSSPTGAFERVRKRLHDRAAKLKNAQRRANEQNLTPRRPLYVNNINSQRLHDCFRTLYGQDDVDIEHKDVFPVEKGGTIRLPTQVDMTHAFEVATSVDMQHLDIGAGHLVNLRQVHEMNVLTHINLNHNCLGDAGVEVLFVALVNSGSSVVHVSVGDNNVGDIGAEIIANSLSSLMRLTSLELCENFIQERGSIALAEAVGGMPPADEVGVGEEVALQAADPLPMLSVDLRGNKSRFLGAMRWAEVIAPHPKLQFLCLAQNELGLLNADSFLGLVYAAVASAALSVLDLRDNFPMGPEGADVGPPPPDVLEDLLPDLPTGEFDTHEVRQGVFIRRHRSSSGGSGAQEKKGRQPNQHGHHHHQHRGSRHSHSPPV